MKFLATSIAVMATLLVATSVEAHVTANPSVAVSGAYFQTNFRVPHGCEGNTTDSITVEIPKGVSSVKPRGIHPWKTDINMVPLAVPVVTPTGTINSTVGSITWSGGALLDTMYEDFGLQFKLPQMEGPLYWNVLQHCVNGGWQNWTNIPDAAGKTAGFPAAVITVSNSTTGAGDGHGGAGAGGAKTDDKKNAAAVLSFQPLAVVLGAAGALALSML